MFDSELNFKHYINTAKTKLSRALYALRTVKNTFNPKSLYFLYNSIFHCHLLYTIQIWSCSRSGPIKAVFKLQKTTVRLISGSAYNAHTEPLFKKLTYCINRTWSLSPNYNSCNDFHKTFFQNLFVKLGLEITFKILVKMKYSSGILINCSPYTQTWSS